MTPILHRAPYALLHATRLLENAAILVSDVGRILRVGEGRRFKASASCKVLDWEGAILMPGLVNAHAHLELTDLQNRVTGFVSFTDWIAKLMQQRQPWTREQYQASARKGARLALESGTTLIGDIAAGGCGWDAVQGEGVRRVVFEEVLSLSPDRVEPVLAQLNRIFLQAAPEPLQVHGVSPHAPYSVSAELYRRTAALAQKQGRILATHAAETQSEIQFLQTGSGEFRDFLVTLGALPADWEPPASSPIAYLDALQVLGPNCLLVHCNYLDEDAVRRIARSRSSVVYCPRSHAFFGHANHPIRRLLDAGVPVALGTDSLASNHSLSMLDEMRFVFSRRADIGAEEIFAAATATGAAALQLGDRLGRLDAGCQADMAVLELPRNLPTRRLLHQILEGAGECLATVVRGRVAWQKENSPKD